MEPAQTIIRKLGGAAKVAARVNRSANAVYKWTHPRERGGSHGVIPAPIQPLLLDMARDEGVDLVPNDFFPNRNVKETISDADAKRK